MPEAIEKRLPDVLAPLLADPERAAVLLDLDGTLAPIVSRPEDAAIPARVSEALVTISARFGLTAIVTGRRAEVARRIVGIDHLTYAGNHGFEVLAPGADAAEPAEAVAARAGEAADFVAQLDRAELDSAGIRVEDKGPIVALHWRRAEDPLKAEQLIDRIAADASSVGLFTHAGRMVIEVRPPVEIDKGVAVAGLLGGSGLRAALYAGDDRTDLDAFAELERQRNAGSLDAVVRVGVTSPEGPAEIAARADLVVEGPEKIQSVLEALAD